MGIIFTRFPSHRPAPTTTSNYGSINSLKAAPPPVPTTAAVRPVSSYGKAKPAEYTAFQLPTKGNLRVNIGYLPAE
jgi:hypothetical protein